METPIYLSRTLLCGVFRNQEVHLNFSGFSNLARLDKIRPSRVLHEGSTQIDGHQAVAYTYKVQFVNRFRTASSVHAMFKSQTQRFVGAGRGSMHYPKLVLQLCRLLFCASSPSSRIVPTLLAL